MGGDQSRLSKNCQMVRDGRLRKLDLTPNVAFAQSRPGHAAARRTMAQRLKDSTPMRLGNRVKEPCFLGASAHPSIFSDSHIHLHVYTYARMRR